MRPVVFTKHVWCHDDQREYPIEPPVSARGQEEWELVNVFPPPSPSEYIIAVWRSRFQTFAAPLRTDGDGVVFASPAVAAAISKDIL